MHVPYCNETPGRDGYNGIITLTFNPIKAIINTNTHLHKLESIKKRKN